MQRRQDRNHDTSKWPYSMHWPSKILEALTDSIKDVASNPRHYSYPNSFIIIMVSTHAPDFHTLYNVLGTLIHK